MPTANDATAVTMKIQMTCNGLRSLFWRVRSHAARPFVPCLQPDIEKTGQLQPYARTEKQASIALFSRSLNCHEVEHAG